MVRLKGAAIAAFTVGGVDLKTSSVVSSVDVGVSHNAVDDTTLDDDATKMINLKSSYQLTVALKADHSIVDFLYGTGSKDQKAVTLTYGTGTNGFKLTGNVLITDPGGPSFQASGDTNDISVTMQASDGQPFAIITNTA